MPPPGARSGPGSTRAETDFRRSFIPPSVLRDRPAEEYLGYGVGMALRIAVDNQSLQFRSAGYFLQLGRLKLRWPAFCSPGALTVRHTDLGQGEFRFTLELVHPRLGILVRQSAVFREARS